MDVTGQPDGPPTRVGIAITDYMAGLYAGQGILLALMDRARTGLGQHVDIALFDSLISALTLPAGILFATGNTPHRLGNDHPSIAPYETLRARGGLVIVAAGNPRLWQALCEAIEARELATDPRFATNQDRLANRGALKAELEARFEQWTLEELIARLEAHRVPSGRVRSIAEAMDHPQVSAREMMLTIDHPELGEVKALGNPIKLSRHPHVPRRPPPRLGEHTDDVLNAVCGQTKPARRW